MTSGGSRRRLGLAALCLYGGSTALAGVAAAIGFGSGGAGAASLDAGTLGRRVSAARPVAAQGAPGAQGGAVSGADVPQAEVARSMAADAPFRPLVLQLPSGMTAPVLSSGLHADGSLVIPDNPATVGWWNGGALAGDVYGSVVIAGHVDSARYGLGFMSQLKTLRTGELVVVEAGTRRMTYRVQSRRSVPQAQLAADTDAFRQDIAPRLVLITCGGAFNPVRHRYQDNLILYAVPVAG